MQVIINKDVKVLEELVAKKIADKINQKPSLVLGLATGSTPLGVYKQLIKMNKDGLVSFKQVKSFNLDEYLGLPYLHNQSYRYFMNENFFNHIDIDINNTLVPPAKLENGQKGEDYDLDIARSGGIDLQILGLGGNGHIAFNEPGTSFDALTHVTDLTMQTRLDNSRFFETFDQVPSQALTMGLGSIMNAKEIVLLAFGEKKAEAVKAMIEGEITTSCPASILQRHLNVTIYLDEAAASLLSK
jgi:glucosamine-6-phosphate deaminase